MSNRRSPAETAAIFTQVATVQEELPVGANYAQLQYLVANDMGIAPIIEAATIHTPQPADKRSLAIGLVIGNGYIDSTLPELPVDAVVMLDNDASVLDLRQYIGSTIVENPTTADFWQRIEQEDTLPEKIAWVLKIGRPVRPPGSLKGLLVDDRGALGDNHFLSSEERYQTCRNALLETPFLYANANVTDVERIGKIGAALAKLGQITYLNVTNVADHLPGNSFPDYCKALAALPIHPQAFVAFSSFVCQAENGGPWLATPPRCHWSQGIADYVARYEATKEWLPRFDEPESNLVWGRQPKSLDVSDYDKLMTQIYPNSKEQQI